MENGLKLKWRDDANISTGIIEPMEVCGTKLLIMKRSGRRRDSTALCFLPPTRGAMAGRLRRWLQRL